MRIIAPQHIATISSTGLHEHEAVHEVSTQILKGVEPVGDRWNQALLVGLRKGKRFFVKKS